MDVELLCYKHLFGANLAPLPQSVELDKVFRLNALSSEPSKDRRVPTADASVLVLHNQTDTFAPFLFDRVLKSWDKRDDETSPPSLVISGSSNDAFYERVSDEIVNGDCLCLAT